tara:strand:- start:777 stop:974 length:198 start_codon:yes stop_codon:yes gene_type:complete
MELITVEGTITINGVDSKFRIDNDINDSWYQWGATQDRLSDSIYIVEALQRGLMEDVAFYNEEEE